MEMKLLLRVQYFSRTNVSLGRKKKKKKDNSCNSISEYCNDIKICFSKDKIKIKCTHFPSSSVVLCCVNYVKKYYNVI